MPVAGRRNRITAPKDTRSLGASGLRAAMIIPLLAALSVMGQAVLPERNLPEAVGAFYGVAKAPPATHGLSPIREAPINGLPLAIPPSPLAIILWSLRDRSDRQIP